MAVASRDAGTKPQMIVNQLVGTQSESQPVLSNDSVMEALKARLSQLSPEQAYMTILQVSHDQEQKLKYQQAWLQQAANNYQLVILQKSMAGSKPVESSVATVTNLAKSNVESKPDLSRDTPMTEVHKETLGKDQDRDMEPAKVEQTSLNTTEGRRLTLAKLLKKAAEKDQALASTSAQAMTSKQPEAGDQQTTTDHVGAPVPAEMRTSPTRDYNVTDHNLDISMFEP